MATGYGICVSHCLRASCDFFYGASGGQPGVNPYRDCAEIVRKSCNVSAVAVQSPQPLHRNRTVPLRGSAFARCRCGGLCNATYDMSTGYGLWAYDFFKFLKLLAKPNRIVRYGNFSSDLTFSIWFVCFFFWSRPPYVGPRSQFQLRGRDTKVDSALESQLVKVSKTQNWGSTLDFSKQFIWKLKHNTLRKEKLWRKCSSSQSGSSNYLQLSFCYFFD